MSNTPHPGPVLGTSTPTLTTTSASLSADGQESENTAVPSVGLPSKGSQQGSEQADHRRNRRPAFWFTNHVINPFLKAVLRSKWSRHWGGRKLAVMHYQGRRTTANNELVAMYAHRGNIVWILPGQADKKTWWKNFRTPGNVELLMEGELHRGTAIAVEGHSDPETVLIGLEVYLEVFPRVRKTIEKHGETLQEAARRTVIVRIQLVE